MKKRPPDFDLRSAAHDRSFIPSRGDLPRLIELLVHPDDGEAAARAIARAGEIAARAVLSAFEGSRPPLRGRLVKVIARIGGHRDWLLQRLTDADAKTRRNAILGLGQHADPEVEAALIAAWDRESIEHRRSIAAALGKIGGSASRELLASVASEDRELARIVSEALLKVERTGERTIRGAIDAALKQPHPIAVRFHCRRGLETIVVDELGDLGARGVAPGVVEVKSPDSIAALFRVRTALRFTFPLEAPARGDLEERVAAAIVAGAPLLSRLTVGPITYRLEWAGQGHRRAATFRVARLVSERSKDLRNDPTDSVWEIIAGEDGSVEAWPKAAADPRFTYRVADVPASSHPTIAAALARVAGTRREEVVWDPFVGAGTELIERAKLGPCAALYGSDVAPAALDAAARNLEAAGLRALLVVSDARVSRPPEPVSLVITNPPMGRRVLDRKSIEPLLDGVLGNARNAMRRDGRVVMLSPIFGRSVELATRHGFRVERRGAVDLGGFDAELQVLEVKRR